MPQITTGRPVDDIVAKLRIEHLITGTRYLPLHAITRWMRKMTTEICHSVGKHRRQSTLSLTGWNCFSLGCMRNLRNSSLELTATHDWLARKASRSKSVHKSVHKFGAVVQKDYKKISPRKETIIMNPLWKMKLWRKGFIKIGSKIYWWQLMF